MVRVDVEGKLVMEPWGVKILWEQGTDRPRIVFSKWVKIKSRSSDHLSYQSKIRNKSNQEDLII